MIRTTIKTIDDNLWSAIIVRLDETGFLVFTMKGMVSEVKYFRFTMMLTIISLLLASCTRSVGDKLPELFLLDSLSPPAYMLHINVTGYSGSGLVFENNTQCGSFFCSGGSDSLSIPAGATSGTFSTTFYTGDNYNVNVSSFPTGPILFCSHSSGSSSGTFIDKDITLNYSCTGGYAVDGALTNLAGTGLKITSSGGGQVTPAGGSATYAFSNSFDTNTAYTLTIANQPVSPTQSCVFDSTGTNSVTLNASMYSNATHPENITCTTTPFEVKVVMDTNHPLDYTGLQIQWGTDPAVSIPAGTTQYSFGNILSGTAYSVGVVSNPIGENCTMTNNTGVVGSGPVTINMSCPNAGQVMQVTVLGYPSSGASLDLLINGTDNHTLTIPDLSSGAGSYTASFPSTFDYNDSYDLSVTGGVTSNGMECKIDTDSSYDAGELTSQSGYIDIGANPITVVCADIEAPVVTLDNVIARGAIRSGFLVGTVSDNLGLASVEVFIDGTPYTPTITGTDWILKLPAGTAMIDGTGHSIQVSATDTWSAPNTTTTTAINVTKQGNADINGDGYTDLVVGNNNGKTFIFYSNGSSGVMTSGNSGSADTTLTGASGSFGNAVATGDINGDGYADVVVGSPNDANGLVAVYLSSGGGGVAASADSIIMGNVASSKFGFSVAAGDVNGDGYSDVIAGSPDDGLGAVYIFHAVNDGSGLASVFDVAGDVTNADTTIDGSVSGSNADSLFGYSVSAYDINGDGYGDVVAGAPAYTENGPFGPVGAVYVFHSSGSGVTASDTTGAASKITGISYPGSSLGTSVVAGDVNGDGYGDVVTGDAALYQAFVFHSNGGSGLSSGDSSIADSTLVNNSSVTNFGTSVAIGDVNGDGYGDVVVGATWVSSYSGAVYIFHSSSSGIGDWTYSGDPLNSGADMTIYGDTDSWFGNSVAARDINGDGYVDVIAGGYKMNTGSGKVCVFHSAGSGGVPDDPGSSGTYTHTGKTDSYILGASAGDQFGIAVNR